MIMMQLSRDYSLIPLFSLLLSRYVYSFPSSGSCFLFFFSSSTFDSFLIFILVCGACYFAFVRYWYLPYYHKIANKFLCSISFVFAWATLLTALSCLVGWGSNNSTNHHLDLTPSESMLLSSSLFLFHPLASLSSSSLLPWPFSSRISFFVSAVSEGQCWRMRALLVFVFCHFCCCLSPLSDPHPLTSCSFLFFSQEMMNFPSDMSFLSCCVCSSFSSLFFASFLFFFS